ncbi:MAG: hypothetical protein NC336_09890 [Clostridium sp.]|nr:hypothetical protein [Clostridium sp.]
MALLNISLYSTTGNIGSIESDTVAEIRLSDTSVIASPGDTIVDISEAEIIIEASECINGGEGSASCGISIPTEDGKHVKMECDVKCKDGYYACCTLSGCHCVESPQ